MPTQRRHIHREVVDKASANMHLIMGYVFLGLVFLGALSSVYYWEYKAKVKAANQPAVIKHVESGEQVPEVNGAACELNPVMARQRDTGELREFPTVCHVDQDWWDVIR
jgi:hypothetical protein